MSGRPNAPGRRHHTAPNGVQIELSQPRTLELKLPVAVLEGERKGELAGIIGKVEQLRRYAALSELSDHGLCVPVRKTGDDKNRHPYCVSAKGFKTVW